MHKSDVVKRMAEKAGLSQSQAAKALAAFQETVQEALRNGEKVVLTGFGTFELRERRERQGMNPKTREKITIPAGRTPGFSASSALKRSIGGSGGGTES
ncbi:MAG: transcriptional regulator [Herpetosiphonaceae bacterium]|nr:MAG: transcriptional regulator [Herpetosiphonaceae bacterium]